MAINPQRDYVAVFRNWSKVTGSISVGVGSLVLVGWWLNIVLLKSLVPGLAVMKANTALSFVCAGLALWLLHTNSRHPRWIALRWAGVILITMVGGLTLSEYVFGWDFGIDQLLVRDTALAATAYPGRMSPITAVNFLLLGLAFFLLDRRFYRSAQLLILTVTGLVLLTLIGYLYGVESLYRIAFYASVALHTAITFLLVCLGLLFVRPDQGLLTVLTSHSVGGVLARRLLPAAIVVPALFGWLCLRGQQAGWYDAVFGLALFVVSNMVVFTLLIARSAVLLHRMDEARQQAVDELCLLNAELDGRVLERTAQLARVNQQLTGEVAEREQAETKFRSLLEAAPDAVVIINPAGNIELINSQAEKLFGYSRAALLGQSVEMLLPERFRGYQALDYSSAPRRWELHLYGLRQNGTEFPVEISLSPVAAAEGRLVIAALRDFSAHKQIEAELRESQERFAILFRNSPAGITLNRLGNGLFLEVNEKFLRQIGFERNEVLGYTLVELGLLSAEEHETITQQLRQLGVLQDLEIEIRLKSGDVRSFLSSVEVVEVNQEACTLSILHDITERKQAEAALAQERDLLQALLDNIPDTIYFKDTASRFTRINQAQARVLGAPELSDVVGKTDADFQSLQLATEFYAEEQQLFKTGRPVIDRQEFNPTAEGRPRWFSTTKVPMFDRQGRVTGLIGISRDITQRVKAEEALQWANTQLTERVSHMALLNELEEQLQACMTVEEVYAITAKLTNQLFPAEVGALYVIHSSRRWVETAALWGAAPQKSETFGLEDCWALRRGRTHLLSANHPHLACRHLQDASPAFSVCLPLLAQGEALGVLHLHATSDLDRHRWDEAKQQLAHVVADSVALALANLNLRETLRQQSIRDPLTQLFNRRYMEEALGRELLRAARVQQPVGFMMLDVDHFKRINDTYGHETGDAVLRQLGSFLKEHTRGSDIACRFGGEEFLLILPDANVEQARLRAEQHRQDFRAIRLQHAGQVIGPITLSFGVAAYPAHGQTSDAVLRAADVALYRAKRAGRDRVAVAG